ncbi:hypothetical protein CR513_52043, partial [Mucuna pruriens]
MDPDEHFAKYITQVNLFNNEDAILCRIFPTFLKGLILHWYMQLPANSTDSFGTLKKFSTQYLTSRTHHLTPMALGPPYDMDDLRTRAIGYIQMEEMIEFHEDTSS